MKKKDIPGYIKAGKYSFDSMNDFLEKESTFFLTIVLVIAFLVSLFLFDLKVSIGGDDSAYIARASDFINECIYPGGLQAPLYPFFLSPFVFFWGINVILLKCLSLACMLCSFFLLYRSFKKQIPLLLLFSSLLLLSVNAHILYFSGQTYSEAFFMLTQGILFFVFNTRFIQEGKGTPSFRKDYKKYLLLGFILLLVSLTRNIGAAGVLAVLLYFLLAKRWKDLLYTILSLILFFILFELIKTAVWDHTSILMSNHISAVFSKNSYNANFGTISYSGIAERFATNSKLFLSKHLLLIAGVKFPGLVSATVTIIIYFLFLLMTLFFFKRNGYLLFAAIYTGVIGFITFMVVQEELDQERFLVIIFPFIVLCFLGSIYYFLSYEKFKRFQFSFLAITFLFFLSALNDSIPAMIKQDEILNRNLQGDEFYGYDDTSKNFIEICRWADSHIPKDKIIASRKADISFIYTGRKFFSIVKLPYYTAEEFRASITGRSDSVYIAVPWVKVQRTNERMQVLEEYRKYLVAALIGEKKDAHEERYIYSFPRKDTALLLKPFSDYQIPYEENAGELISSLQKNGFDINLYNPDNLLQTLHKENIRYLIVSNMCGNIMYRYKNFIEIKYPIFREVAKAGENWDDVAILYEIRYELLDPE
jgi:hypothetical protein